MNLYDYLEMLTPEGKKKLQETLKQKGETISAPKPPPTIPPWIKAHLTTYQSEKNLEPLKESNFSYGSIMNLVNSWGIQNNKLNPGTTNKIVVTSTNFYSVPDSNKTHDDILLWMILHHEIKMTQPEFKVWNAPDRLPQMPCLCLTQHKAGEPYFLLSESYGDDNIEYLQKNSEPFEKILKQHGLVVVYKTAREFHDDLEEEIKILKRKPK